MNARDTLIRGVQARAGAVFRCQGHPPWSGELPMWAPRRDLIGKGEDLVWLLGMADSEAGRAEQISHILGYRSALNTLAPTRRLYWVEDLLVNYCHLLKHGRPHTRDRCMEALLELERTRNGIEDPRFQGYGEERAA